MPKTCCNNVVLHDRADIQQDSRTGDNPQPVYTGTPFKTGVPCNIITTSGDETFRGRQLEATVSHVVEMRWFPGITPTMRLSVTGGIYKDRILNIKAVKPVRKDSAPPMQWLYCEELA